MLSDRAPLRMVLLSTIVTGAFLVANTVLAGVTITYHSDHGRHGISGKHGNKHHGHNHGTAKWSRNQKQDSHHNRSIRHHGRYGYRYHHYGYPSYYWYHRYKKKRHYDWPRVYYRYSYGPSSYYNYYPYHYRYRDYQYHSRSRYRSHKNITGDPWAALVNGQSRKALIIFSKDAQSYPKAGMPKAGLAIAAASSGDLKTGIWAMRRAFETDPESLYEMGHDTRLHHTIDELITKYQYPLRHRRRHKDEAFMVAALNYIKGDYAAAETAMQRAAKDRDRSKSFKNLQHLLASQKPGYQD